MSKIKLVILIVPLLMLVVLIFNLKGVYGLIFPRSFTERDRYSLNSQCHAFVNERLLHASIYENNDAYLVHMKRAPWDFSIDAYRISKLNGSVNAYVWRQIRFIRQDVVLTGDSEQDIPAIGESITADFASNPVFSNSSTEVSISLSERLSVHCK